MIYRERDRKKEKSNHPTTAKIKTESLTHVAFLSNPLHTFKARQKPAKKSTTQK